MASDMLSDIKERLNKKNIHEVRQIAREAGVCSPTTGKKEQLIEDIIAIASCEVAPAPRATRGAPPKSSGYDEALVRDIMDCISYYTLLKAGNEAAKFEISDGTAEQVCQGILVKVEDNFFLRTNGCLPNADDVYVREYLVNKFSLQEGDFVNGECRQKSHEEFAMLTKIHSVGGYSPESVPRREFAKLTPIYPKNRLRFVNSGKDIAARMIDLFAPVGYGQRAVISAAANSGKTALIKQIASGIFINNVNSELIIFVVAGSPEEITDIERSSFGAKVFSTTFDMEQEQHVQAAEFIATYCKNTVESGKDVVLIVEGLSKLGSSAKRLLSSAICAEEGGSLTVIATVSAQGEYSSEYSAELLSVANMRAALTDCSNHTPVLDLIKSYTLNCELLQTEQELKTADTLRKQYQTTGNIQEILNLFKNTENNVEIIKSNG